MKDNTVKRFSLTEYSNDKVLSIPSYAFYQGKLEKINFSNVEKVGNESFSNNNLISINLPKVLNIGERAFYNNPLTNLNLPTVEEIKYRAFYNCPLKQISIPKIKKIESYAFCGCTIDKVDLSTIEDIGSQVFGRTQNGCMITELSMPNLKRTGSSAFSEVSTLKNVFVPKIENVGPYSFEYTSLTSFDAPEALIIGSHSFDYCESLENVNIPKAKRLSTDSGGESYAFRWCSNLKNVNAPSLEEVGAKAFAGCSNLESISLPNVVGNVGAYAFQRCTNLTNIYVPKISYIVYEYITENQKLKKFDAPSAKDWQMRGFVNCKVLEVIKLGAIQTIGENASVGCSALHTTVISQPNSVCTLNNINAFSNTPIAAGSGSIYVPDSLVDSYKAATNWSVYANQIKPLSEYVEKEVEQ